ncbi:dihydrodipicolinate synthase DapA [Gottschalkia acidurici 9a]|uniref:4-hydroxy-tetrahydrodipicolinate synthase n=1 Tax=Gottschalkia acidurici (strain ATCC 7906 / DSM 604 / BCRC 14475 / CIP 104303 / KCTC 5404 / NCIMB 10678 / 9a) TaxID=1128398 RepID=K0AZI1_GOTA9|nr:4-hydroxy-tetrahydrodipicolinate synthase [Gottschalkia acidurici]AFS78192.1 dihydrodipicolinate synthase DapA [Gottschalkia acidurici 9a]
MKLFEGSGVAIVTPFTKDNKVDYVTLSELIEFHIENQTDAIVICGTTGESATLSDKEHKETIEFTVKQVNGRIPVIAGVGSNDTSYAINLSKFAESVGADALLTVTPYYNKASQKGLIKHFTAIADSVNTPIILYNVPGRTGVSIQAKTVAELSKHKNIAGIKEASGDLGLVIEIARLCPEDFYIYSGNDDIVVPTLSIGGKGVISVVANILPKETHDMVASYLNGDIDKARKLQLSLKELIDALFIEPNPIPIKTAMNLLGKEVGDLRLPLCEMSDENLKALTSSMTNYGLL